MMNLSIQHSNIKQRAGALSKPCLHMSTASLQSDEFVCDATNFLCRTVTFLYDDKSFKDFKKYAGLFCN